MAWIESHEELLNHPKSKRLKRKLGVSEHEVIGILHFFWHWAVKFAEDGVITKFSAEDIADAIHFDGDADKLIRSLIESGFVDETDGERTIHDWFDYAGKLILWRRKEADRLKNYRKKNKTVHSTDEERTMYEPSTDTVRTPVYSNSYSKSNKEDIKDSGTKVPDRKKFIPPTLEQVTEYCFERGNRVDPENWYDHYTANGWKVGKNQMKDWKAAVRTWEKNKVNSATTSKPYQSKADRAEEQRNALKQSILGGVSIEDINQGRSRVDITPDSSSLSQLRLEF